MRPFSKKDKGKYICELYRENGQDVEVFLTLEEKIQREEQEIKSRFPDAYRNFLMETPFEECQTFPDETPYDGIFFYPKAMAKVEEFYSTFDAFYVPSETGEEGSWVEPKDEQIGCLMVFLYGGEGFYSLKHCNNGSWTMPCICIGILNDDLMIVLNCETGRIYCTQHDEVFFEFNSREDYDRNLPLVAEDVMFPDFDSFLTWCRGESVYIPKSVEKQ